jgi:L,D-peptidoglycan transpeptidase YkuD (ErfK/YbiS/YcfS/YnhG family)
LGPVLSVTANLSIAASTLTNVIASAGGLTAAASGLASKFGAFAVGGAVAGAIAYFVKGLKDAKEQIDMINKGIDGLTIAQLNEKLAALEKEKAKLNELISRGDEGLFVDTSHAEERLENINKKIKETKTQISELKEKPEPASSADEGDSGSDTGGKSGGKKTKQEKEEKTPEEIFQETKSWYQNMVTLGQATREEYKKWLKEQFEATKEIVDERGLVHRVDKLNTETRAEIKKELDKMNKKEENWAQEIMEEGYETAILQMEGLQKELMQLQLSKRKELESIGEYGVPEEKMSIKGLSILKKYKVKKENLFNKYDEKREEAAEKLQNKLALLREEGKEKELEKLDQWYEEEQEKYKGNEEALTALKKLHEEKRQDIEEEYAGKEQELQDERMENKFALNQISLQQYKEYLQERLKDYEEYTDEWLKLKEKIDNLEVTPAEVESEYTEELELLKQKNEAFGDSFDFVAEKTKLVKDTLDRLIETGNKDSVIFTELNNLYNNLTGDDEAESLNWMTDAFVDLGLEIETANKKFKDWKQDLVNGLSDAIVKGEDLGDVFSNIADQIAAMVIKKAIVQPIVTWGLEAAGLGSAHEGAYVSPRGLIQDLPSYHSGGLPGLDRDETIIKAQTGERVLSRDQNEALLSGQLGGNTNVTLIQAVDSKSFQQMLAENRATVTQLSVEDIMKNGQLRKVLKQYL